MYKTRQRAVVNLCSEVFYGSGESCLDFTRLAFYLSLCIQLRQPALVLVVCCARQHGSGARYGLLRIRASRRGQIYPGVHADA